MTWQLDKPVVVSRKDGEWLTRSQWLELAKVMVDYGADYQETSCGWVYLIAGVPDVDMKHDNLDFVSGTDYHHIKI